MLFIIVQVNWRSWSIKDMEKREVCNLDFQGAGLVVGKRLSSKISFSMHKQTLPLPGAEQIWSKKDHMIHYGQQKV